MRITDILLPETLIPELSAPDGETAVRQLVSALARVRTVDVEAAVRDLAARSKSGGTLIPLGPLHVALPHARTAACKQLMLAVATSRNGIVWDAAGSKANIVFLFIGPPPTHSLYLRMLSRIARLCSTAGFADSLLRAESAKQLIEAIADAEKPLGDIVSAEGMPSFCVMGAGPGGLAMAAHLSILGCKVNLFNRTEAHIAPIRTRGGIDVTGEVEGLASLNVVTSDPAKAIENVDVIMVAVPATAHGSIAEVIAPHVKDGQVLILNPGRTGGALEVAKVFREKNPSVRPYIAEAQTLLYSARATNPGQIHILGIKNSVPLATLPAYHIPDVLPIVRKALPQFVAGENVLKTGLDNVGAVFHPAITVLNAGRIEDTHGDFEYYVEGVTPAVAAILEAADRERVRVAGALGMRVNTAREWLYLAYDAAGKTVLEAMRANTGYSGIKAPAAVEHRYISEDVPASLVPIASIGDMLGVPTPTIKSIIQLASTMLGVDYWARGRTVERLGIKGMSAREIRFLVVGAVSDPTPTSGPPAQGIMSPDGHIIGCLPDAKVWI